LSCSTAIKKRSTLATRRNRVGSVLQDGRECLRLSAGDYDRPRGIDETIALVGFKQNAETLGER